MKSHDAGEVEPKPEDLPRPKPPKVPALYRPQQFVDPRHFLNRHLQQNKRKKPLVIAGSVLITLALGWGGLHVLSGRTVRTAAAQTADSFIQAEFSGDTEKALKLADPSSIKADNLKALALLVKPTLKSQPVRTGQDIQKQDGQHRAVFTYRFAIGNPRNQKAEAVPVHIVLLLQKDKDHWRVKSQSMSAVAPKADVTSYRF